MALRRGRWCRFRALSMFGSVVFLVSLIYVSEMIISFKN